MDATAAEHKSVVKSGKPIIMVLPSLCCQLVDSGVPATLMTNIKRYRRPIEKINECQVFNQIDSEKLLCVMSTVLRLDVLSSLYAYLNPHQTRCNHTRIA